jgi:hypothetical protein
MNVRKADRPTEGKWWYIEEDFWSGMPRVMTRVGGCQGDILIASLGQQRETRQNGHLISASKELRRALIRLLKVTRDHVETCDNWGKLAKAQAIADSALTKASSKQRKAKAT